MRRKLNGDDFPLLLFPSLILITLSLTYSHSLSVCISPSLFYFLSLPASLFSSPCPPPPVQLSLILTSIYIHITASLQLSIPHSVQTLALAHNTFILLFTSLPHINSSLSHKLSLSLSLSLSLTLTFLEALARELMISCVVPCGRQQNAISQSSIAAEES